MEFNLAVIEWLLSGAPDLPPGLENLTTMGSGPLPEEEFDSLLGGSGVDVYDADEDTSVLVIGRETWHERRLRKLLDLRSGGTLRVYSQEMFLAYLVSGDDPLVGDEEEVRRLAGDHPGLRFLEAVGFRWPTTIVGPRTGGEIDEDLLPESFLMHSGYNVRASGPPDAHRRQILRHVYEKARVPSTFPRAADWGAPGTSKRLCKLAVTIASICTLHKKRSMPPEQAIKKWEADLRWLKRRFYHGHFQFRWPSTGVW